MCNLPVDDALALMLAPSYQSAQRNDAQQQ